MGSEWASSTFFYFAFGHSPFWHERPCQFCAAPHIYPGRLALTLRDDETPRARWVFENTYSTSLCGRIRYEEDVVYLEVGDRPPGDEGRYPDDDLKALLVDGKWRYVHQDGAPYA